jgi:hypothetical protein
MVNAAGVADMSPSELRACVQALSYRGGAGLSCYSSIREAQCCYAIENTELLETLERVGNPKMALRAIAVCNWHSLTARVSIGSGRM